MELRFSKMKYKHIKECVKMLNDEWDLGKEASKSEGNICAKIYMLEILIYGSRLIVCTSKNKVVGFVGYYNKKDKKLTLRKSIYRLLQKLLCLSPKIKNKEKIKEYYNVYEYTPNEIKELFDSELDIIMVASEHRKKGIGKILFEKICEVAKQDGIRKMQIDTDDSCTYKFYELNNCRKVYETEIRNGEKIVEKAYVYERVI